MKKQAVIALALIILMFLADGINSLLLNSGSDFGSISVFIRFFVQVYFIYLLLRTRQGYPIIIISMFFYLIFVLGSFTYVTAIGYSNYDLLGNFRIINKMLFVFVCWEALRILFNTAQGRKNLFKAYEVLSITQASVILLAFIFNLELFSAYRRINEEGAITVARFGYQGLIPSQNEVAAYFIIAFFYFLIKAKSVPKIRNLFILLIMTLAALFTGTKVTLVLPLVFVYFISREFLLVRRKNIYFVGIITISLLIAAAICNQEYLLSRLQPTINYYSSRFAQYRLESVIDLFLLGRKQKTVTLLQQHISQFNLANFLFGGVDLRQAATETDLLDVMARLGLLGGTAYYLFYLRILFYSKYKLSFYRLLFIVIWLSVSTVAGHVVFSAINSVYLVILMFAFYSFEIREFQFITTMNPDYQFRPVPI